MVMTGAWTPPAQESTYIYYINYIKQRHRKRCLHDTRKQYYEVDHIWCTWEALTRHQCSRDVLMPFTALTAWPEALSACHNETGKLFFRRFICRTIGRLPEKPRLPRHQCSIEFPTAGWCNIGCRPQHPAMWLRAPEALSAWRKGIALWSTRPCQRFAHPRKNIKIIFIWLTYTIDPN